jgi:hypothetical protein
MYNISLFGIVTMTPPYNKYILIKKNLMRLGKIYISKGREGICN